MYRFHRLEVFPLARERPSSARAWQPEVHQILEKCTMLRLQFASLQFFVKSKKAPLEGGLGGEP